MYTTSGVNGSHPTQSHPRYSRAGLAKNPSRARSWTPLRLTLDSTVPHLLFPSTTTKLPKPSRSAIRTGAIGHSSERGAPPHRRLAPAIIARVPSIASIPLSAISFAAASLATAEADAGISAAEVVLPLNPPQPDSDLPIPLSRNSADGDAAATSVASAQSLAGCGGLGRER